jgi:hypothetical protein
VMRNGENEVRHEEEQIPGRGQLDQHRQPGRRAALRFRATP